jgi:hypothetical protein
VDRGLRGPKVQGSSAHRPPSPPAISAQKPHLPLPRPHWPRLSKGHLQRPLHSGQVGTEMHPSFLQNHGLTEDDSAEPSLTDTHGPTESW